MLVLLIGLTLAPTLMGRAGFLMVERGVAARIFALHQHGVPGEAEYISHHGAPAPFVHPHCHRDPGAGPDTTPAELAAGALLFGPLLCGAGATLPPGPVDGIARTHDGETAPAAADRAPETPPPQA